MAVYKLMLPSAYERHVSTAYAYKAVQATLLTAAPTMVPPSVNKLPLTRALPFNTRADITPVYPGADVRLYEPVVIGRRLIYRS